MTRAAARGEAQEWALAASSYDFGDRCLLWPFKAKSGSGYGSIKLANGKMTGSHRLVCELAHGAPPAENLECAHSCGGKLCCNPRHLRWSTPIENAADKAMHGTTNAGSRNGSAKLTAAEVLRIRSLRAGGTSGADLSRQYGVSQASISLIVNGHNWASV